MKKLKIYLTNITQFLSGSFSRPRYQLIPVILVTFLLGYYFCVDSFDSSKSEEFVSIFASLDVDFYETGIQEKHDKMTGPFELLNDKELLFITLCGEVYLSRIINEMERLESRKTGSIKSVECIDDIKIGVKDTQLYNDFLLVSYVEKNGASYRLVLDRIPRKDENFDFNNASRLFESTPDISPPQLQYNQTYGRIAKRDENQIYLIIGDYGVPKFIDDEDSTLGKLFLVDVNTGSSLLVAKGFRSPGGLYYDQDNNMLWGTEHGPRGGDEVNLIEEGNHYGWPHVTYGATYDRIGQTDYYGLDWGHHEGYKKPAYVFVPSVGVSNIMKYPIGGEITKWHGDLILTTLSNGIVYRLKVEEHSIIYAEPIAYFDFRIRDIQINDEGIIYLKTDNNKLILLTADI